ncbi:NAD(P)-binding protein [Coniochaeta hoffmannii]|uniref:Probable quinone oxidoreductase n=1 Tax=Coniochaeta hoffmannii TaxID=91930 RepID=A0AA38VD34_9PEZI|nr:NAD(P)-binding protein [Coniochaeta hoffmannii]
MAPIPKTMAGIVIESTGGPEVLKYKTDLPVPELKEGEVLVRNEYIGVNFIDTYFRTGLYKAPLPLITGKEAAGTVAAAHPSVASRFPEGTRVGYLADHAYAALTAVPAARVIPLPDGVTTKQAASSLLQGLTALTFIREAAGLANSVPQGEGPWVLVHAAAGGVGTWFVQVLSAMGARVIGTASSPEKCEVARGNGAGWTVNSREDVVAKVKEITGGEGVDVIFDGVGKATFDGDLEMVRRKGTVVMVGNASGAVPPFDILRLGPKNIKLLRPVLFNYITTPEELETYTKELFELISSGKVKVKVHEEYPLKDVARAHSDLEGRKTMGKLILKL